MDVRKGEELVLMRFTVLFFMSSQARRVSLKLRQKRLVSERVVILVMQPENRDFERAILIKRL